MQQLIGKGVWASHLKFHILHVPFPFPFIARTRIHWHGRDINHSSPRIDVCQTCVHGHTYDGEQRVCSG